MEEIKLEKKWFRIGFKPNLRNNTIITIFIISIFILFSFFLFFHFYENFNNFYHNAIIQNFQQNISEINNYELNDNEKIKRFQNTINNYLKNKFVICIWMWDNQENIVLYSFPEVSATKSPINNNDYKEKYKFVFSHLWKFAPDGTAYPLIKNKQQNDYIEIFYPIYNNQNKIDYITGMQFNKYLTKMIYIPKLKIFINIIYIGIISFGVLLICLAALLIIIFSIIDTKKINRWEKELLTKLYELNSENIPNQFNLETYNFKNNFILEFIKYLNYLFEHFKLKLNKIDKTNNDLKQIFSPMLFQQKDDKTPLRINYQLDDLDLKKILWSTYFKDSSIKDFPGYTASLYHYYKENDSDTIFRYFDISANKKGFVLARIIEANSAKKVLLLSVLNFIFQSYKENILQTDGFISTINLLINRIGKSELSMHFAYTILDTETNYIEVTSTGFSPIILFNADNTEFSFYPFKSIPVGKRDNNEFLKELKKETFKLDYNDIFIISDNNFEQLYNYSNDKFEIYKITEIIKANQEAPANVIVDKIKEQLTHFSVDFSKIMDLTLLVIKKTKKDEA